MTSGERRPHAQRRTAGRTLIEAPRASTRDTKAAHPTEGTAAVSCGLPGGVRVHRTGAQGEAIIDTAVELLYRYHISDIS